MADHTTLQNKPFDTTHINGRELIRFILIVLIPIITACSADHRPGYAQDQAASAAGRADATRGAADQAAIDAAAKDGAATALETQAKTTPTAELIRRAAEARADAITAQRVAAALERLAADASSTATAKARAAATERAAEQAEADRRWWVGITRAVGLAGVLLGLLIGGALARYASPREGAFWGILIAGAGVLAAGYGATLSWLPAVSIGTVAVAAIAGLLVWWRRHGATAGVAIAASRTIDAMESEPIPDASEAVAQAKIALGRAVDRSGMRSRLDKMRGATRRWLQ